MFEQATLGSKSRSSGQDVAGGSVGKRTLTEGLGGNAAPGAIDARGGHSGKGVVDDRGTGALIGGAIGAVGGAVLGGLVGGVPGAIGGAVLGGAAGAGIGALVGGAGGGAAATVPTPIAVRNGPTHAPIDSGDNVGMSIAITITSSTGNDADMARIQDSEKVGLSYNHTGSARSLPPLPSNQSSFMPGHPIPDDQHVWSRAEALDLADNHGGSGSFEKQQLDIYTDAAAGVTTPIAIPHSGYIIKRSVIQGAGTLVTLRTEKWGARASVAGYTSEAGPSGLQSEAVILRA